MSLKFFFVLFEFTSLFDYCKPPGANPSRFMLNSLEWYAVLWLSCLWEPLHNIRTSPVLFGWNSTTDNASSGLSSTCAIKQTVHTGRGDILAVLVSFRPNGLLHLISAPALLRNNFSSYPWRIQQDCIHPWRLP